MDQKTVGLQRTCHQCHDIFHICTACDRWHWCCSRRCRDDARKASQRRASSAYRSTEKGKKNSRKSQREYRRRQGRRKKSVSHQSSPLTSAAVDPPLQTILKEVSLVDSCPLPPPKAAKAVGNCRVCGQPIYFLVSLTGFTRRRPRRGRLTRCKRLRTRPRSNGCSTPST